MKRNKLMLIPMILVAAACATTDPYVDPATPAMGGMADSEIAGIIMRAHEGEVSQGEAARSRAVNEEVRAFAQMMVSDHSAAADRLRTVLSAGGMTTSDNDTSRQLRDNSARAITALNTYSGRDFDREYIRAQVAMHEWMLSGLDNAFIPSARNASLRTYLQNARMSVSSHLDRARRIQAGL